VYVNRSKTIVAVNVFALQLILVTGTASVTRGADPVLGTWKLDTVHSKYIPGPGPRSETRVYSESPKGIRVKVTTVDAKGKTETTEYPTNFDGKDYVQPGTNPGDTVSLTRNNDYHASAVLKHADKSMANVERFISDDGQTMTITFKGTAANGDAIGNRSIYQRVGPETKR
jgi:hypothetical protein